MKENKTIIVVGSGGIGTARAQRLLSEMGKDPDDYDLVSKDDLEDRELPEIPAFREPMASSYNENPQNEEEIMFIKNRAEELMGNKTSNNQHKNCAKGLHVYKNNKCVHCDTPTKHFR